MEIASLTLNLAQDLAGLSGIPGLSSAAGVVSASAKAAQNVKVYKRQCCDLNAQCVKLLLAVRENQEDYPMGRSGDENIEASRRTAEALHEMEATIGRINQRITRWSQMNFIQSAIRQSAIKEAIESSYKEIEFCFKGFQITVFSDQNRVQQEHAAIQARDQADIRELLQSLTASIQMIVADYRPEVPALMQSIQEELHDAPTLAPEQKTSFRQGLRELRRETSLLPPLTDLTGQVGKISEQAVALGGSSDVHTGMWLDDEKVALKRHRMFNASETARKRFVKEVEIWRSLQSEYILPFYGITYAGDYVYTVSPWMDNGNAKEYLARNPDVLKIRVFRQIAAGMEYLHANKVIHGDLRGGNVLISAEGKACIADFGLSKILEEIDQGTQSSVILGSLRWLAPEVIKPELIGAYQTSLSTQTDAWSFGMTLLELATNGHPFSDISRDFSVSQALVEGLLPHRPPINPQLQGLDDDLWNLMVLCWDSEPDARPSMVEIKATLMRLERVSKRTSNLSSALSGSQSTSARPNAEVNYSPTMLPQGPSPSPSQWSLSSGGGSLPKDSYMTRRPSTSGGQPSLQETYMNRRPSAAASIGRPSTGNVALQRRPSTASSRHGQLSPIMHTTLSAAVPEHEVPHMNIEQRSAGIDSRTNSSKGRHSDRRISNSSSNSGFGDYFSSVPAPPQTRYDSYDRPAPPPARYDPYDRTAPLPPLRIPSTPELTPSGGLSGQGLSPGTEGRSSASLEAPFALEPTRGPPESQLSGRTGKTDGVSSTEATVSPEKTPFWKRNKKDVDHPVFGKSLSEGLAVASVAVPVMLGGGRTAYGALPIVVTKCGYWLKVHGLHVVGLFRRREGGAGKMRKLQVIFETPPQYGKLLDMKGDYDVYDVAGILRKFLQDLPEPVVPLEFYPQFIEALKIRSDDETIAALGQVFRVMPTNNVELLMYMLDLLATFAKNSAKNMMSVKDLVATFQPELLHHPDRSWWDGEERRCQKVLEVMVHRLPQLMTDRHAARQDT